MTDLFNRLDFYISLIGIGLVVYLWGRRWWKRFIMSRSAPVRYEQRPIVSPGTVAVEPPMPNQFAAPSNWYANRTEPTIDLVMLGLADRDMLIDILSVLKKDDEYLFSANKILELVGGTASDVKSRVASHRPKPPAPKIKPHLDRPVNGWK